METFDLPETARGHVFSIEVTGNGAFIWKEPDGQALAQSQVGSGIQATWQGQPIGLKVRSIVGKPGQRFFLQRQQPLEAIEDLRKSLTVTEKGKESNILVLTFMHPDPALGAEILNAILDQCDRANIERKTGEGSKTLALLQSELSQARADLLKAEERLNQFRANGRSGDLGEEGRLVIQRRVDLEKEVLALNQKKAELLRTYTEQADVVSTVNQQIAKLQEEGRRLDTQGKSLPHDQQEVLRLTQDVQVKQELYNSLMNLEAVNFQQIQMAKSGDIGDVRILDHAMPSLRPVKPVKAMVIGIGTVLGALTGIGIIMLSRSLRPPKLEDPQVLETQFQLPVLVTIPHSSNQSDLARRFSRRKMGEEINLLASAFPLDIAVESLRSLRIGIQFTILDSPHRSILFAGASPEIGKSFVSANFALVLAQDGARVLVIDGDMRQGKLHRLFGAMNRRNGLSEILLGTLAWREALHHTQGLDLIGTGILPPNPAKLLHGERFGLFMAEVCAAYDFVIIDAPPILAVTDAAIIAPHVGAVVLVVKDGQHPVGEIRAALRCLEIAGAQAKGFVFNDFNPRGAPLGYRRYAYHYTYQT